jgi:hypothetical protein
VEKAKPSCLIGGSGWKEAFSALMAKLVRHLICNEKIGGSNPPGSIL